MFSSLTNYSYFVYTLPDRYPSIQRSTLVLKPTGATVGELEGEIVFAGGVKLSVYEVVNFQRAAMTYYSYTVYRGDEKLYWYDPQPHPDDPTLASTHPHHKHVPPDLKHHRVPAPGLGFESPNLPLIIQEIAQELLTSDDEAPPTATA